MSLYRPVLGRFSFSFFSIFSFLYPLSPSFPLLICILSLPSHPSLLSISSFSPSSLFPLVHFSTTSSKCDLTRTTTLLRAQPPFSYFTRSLCRISPRDRFFVTFYLSPISLFHRLFFSPSPPPSPHNSISPTKREKPSFVSSDIFLTLYTGFLYSPSLIPGINHFPFLGTWAWLTSTGPGQLLHIYSRFSLRSAPHRRLASTQENLYPDTLFSLHLTPAQQTRKPDLTHSFSHLS